VLLLLVPAASLLQGTTAALAAGPSFSSQPASPGNDVTPTWTFTVGGGKPMSCVLTHPDGTSDAPVPCTSGTFTVDLTGLAQGAYTLRVTETVGGLSVSSTYALDTLAPPAPVVTGPTGPSRQMTGVFTLYDAEPGVTWVCRVTAPGGTTSYTSCSQGTWTATFSAEGTYTGYISVRDAAGNTSAETVHSYTVDLTAPAAPSVTPVAGAHPPRTPSYTLSGEPGGTWACTVTDPAGGSTATVCTAGTHTLDLQGADGPWSLAVRQTDAAGNVGALTTVHYLLDTVAPGLPGVTGPTGPSRNRTPTYTLSGETGASFVCALSEPSGASNAITCSAGALALDLTDPAHVDGTYSLAVHQVDAAGNVGATRTTSYLLDSSTTAPTVDGPSGPSSVTNPVFQLGASESGTFDCTVTSPAGVVTNPACTAGAFVLDASPGPDGAWRLSVTHADGAGNVSAATTATYELDTATPNAPGVAGPLGPHAPRHPGYAISGEQGATFGCLLTGPGVSSAIPCAEGILVLDLTGDSGSYSLRVTQTDEAGHESPPSTVTYLLDADPPAMPIISGPTGADPTQPVFTLSGEPGGSWSCTLTDPASSYVVLPCAAGDLQLDLTSGAGDYVLSVTQLDDAHNVSPTATRTYALSSASSPSASPSASPSPSPSPSSSPQPFIGPVPPAPAAFVGPVAPDPAPLVGPAAVADSPTTPSPTPSAAPSATSQPTPSAAPSPAAPIGPVQQAEVPQAQVPLDTSPDTDEAPAPAVPSTLTAPDEANEVAAAAQVVDTSASGPTTVTGPPVVHHSVANPVVGFASASRVLKRNALRVDKASATVGDQWQGALRLVGAAGRTGGPPVLLLLIAFAFLAAQDRIDRNDPKLALAPVHGHQELSFKPVDRGTP
jgi:hypothetical protein